ncbi:MAG: 6-phosphogluconolactonase [Patescibacteria group bacterium]
MKLLILPNQPTLAKKAAQLFSQSVEEAIKIRGVAVVALAGGGTPQTMHRLLTEEPFRSQIDWSKVHIFLSDERFVPYEGEDNNYRIIYEYFLSKVPLPIENLHPYITKHSTPENAARIYTADIQELLGNNEPKFDLIFLGIGPDGHTASLFPALYKPHNDEDLILVITESPKPPSIRLSFSLKLINTARHVVIMASGKEKAPIIKEILENREVHKNLPVAMIQPENGELFWLLDKDAASLLTTDQISS